MKTIELFAGTQSFSKVARERGHSTYCIDHDSQLDNDLCENILELGLLVPFQVGILWASPPCTTFSVASISTHWKGGSRAYIPKTKECEIGLKLLEKTIYLIHHNEPKNWFIENPRGVMRKVIDRLFKKYNVTNYRRVTAWYCQYGDTRAKPTDIWTNLKDWNPKTCKNNNPDCNHVRAPRGAKTGTQGLKNASERSRIPSKLFEEIFDIIKNKKSCRANNVAVMQNQHDGLNRICQK